jgi:hypothetical protein
MVKGELGLGNVFSLSDVRPWLDINLYVVSLRHCTVHPNVHT